MEWVTVQLAPWAKMKLSTAELEKAIKKKLVHEELLIFYPVIEDRYGKKDSPYAEYVFISYHEDLDYSVLEDMEEFQLVLKLLKSEIPQTITDNELQNIRDQVNALGQLNRDDVVRIMEGPLKGNFGVVTDTYDGEANLLVTMGSEIIQASISFTHLRYSKKRTVIRKNKLNQSACLSNISKGSLNDKESNLVKLMAQAETKVDLPDQPSSDQKIQKVIRRGLKNTRVVINGKSVLLDNSELRKRLSGMDNIPLE